MSRANFQKYFQTVFGVAIPQSIQDIVEPAEDRRDRLMHGRNLGDPQVREAISRVVNYANELNVFLDSRRVGFRPFCADLRGFVWDEQVLEPGTSRRVLKGMGFDLASRVEPVGPAESPAAASCRQGRG